MNIEELLRDLQTVLNNYDGQLSFEYLGFITYIKNAIRLLNSGDLVSALIAVCKASEIIEDEDTHMIILKLAKLINSKIS